MNLDKKDRRMWRTALQTIRPFPLISAKTKLLVGVSGGADSLALLHLLWRQLGAERLVVAHLHHGLQAEADADAVFVQETAAAWQIPCVVHKVDVTQAAAQERLSLEAAGRQVRYRFFAEQAALSEATAVAVAHHADDQAETVLLNIVRGSGSTGLRGMLPVTVLPGTTNMPLLRPFLNSRRADIEAYCTRHGLTPRQDASNEDVQFTRNRIRHELLPLLQSYNPQITARLQQLATITADEQAVLLDQFAELFPTLVTAQGEASLILDRNKFRELPVAWQRLALRRGVHLLRPLHSEVSFRTTEQARTLILANDSGSESTLPGGLVLRVEAAEIVIGEPDESRQLTVPQLLSELPEALPVPGEITLAGGWRVTAVAQPKSRLSEIRQNADRWRAFVAVGETDQLWLRSSLPGERFQPLGLGGHSQTIQDLLSDRKVERGRRPLWPVVATENHPAWIVGQHLDERARVTEQSRRIVQLICTQSAA